MEKYHSSQKRTLLHNQRTSTYFVRGSNLLINDDRRFEQVVHMSKACLKIAEPGEGRLYIGASNWIQKVISFVNDFEYGKGCFGTCFKEVDYRILRLVTSCDKVWRLGKSRITMGRNNENGLVNHGNGKYQDAIRIINACKRIHRLCRKEAQCEVVIWE